MTPRPATVVASTPVSTALERMAVLGVGRLPVVSEDDPERLVGVFRREDAVRAYHEALTASTDVELQRARLAQRTDPGAGYYEFRIPPGSMADGRAIREVAWPEGSTLVSIRRERQVQVPSGDTVLSEGRRGDGLRHHDFEGPNDRASQCRGGRADRGDSARRFGRPLPGFARLPSNSRGPLFRERDEPVESGRSQERG